MTAPVTVAILSDTHLPRGTRRLPDACRERLSRADLIIHAGDFSRMPILEELTGFGEVVAVHGNVEEPALLTRLPARAECTRAGVRIGVIHDAGPARGRLARLARAFPGCDAVIFGHSHIPLHEQDPVSGFQIFNPGSPTDPRRQPAPTMGWAELRDGAARFALVSLSGS